MVIDSNDFATIVPEGLSMRSVLLCLTWIMSFPASLVFAQDQPVPPKPASSSFTRAKQTEPRRKAEPIKRVVRSEREWQKRLTRPQYLSMRLKATETAFTGTLWNHHEEGFYECAACETLLFSSAAKFNSGTGWPSFFAALSEKRYKTEIDLSEGPPRLEVKCAGCDSHLGHIFQDGPAPTGLRFCINSVALKFLRESEIPAPEEKPAERREKPPGPGERRLEFK